MSDREAHTPPPTKSTINFALRKNYTENQLSKFGRDALILVAFLFGIGSKENNPTNKDRVFLMRCAKGIFAKGILGGTGVSLWRWEKGSKTPSCGGKKGLRLPRSSCSDLGNEGVSDPFSHRKRES